MLVFNGLSDLQIILATVQYLSWWLEMLLRFLSALYTGTSTQQYMLLRSLSETFVEIAPTFASHRFITQQLTANRKPSYHSHFMYLGNLLLNGVLSVVWQRRIGKPTFNMSLLLIQSWRKQRTFQKIYNIPGLCGTANFKPFIAIFLMGCVTFHLLCIHKNISLITFDIHITWSSMPLNFKKIQR
jgi:hypothetical protein